MPKKKTVPKTVRQTTTYADLERILKEALAGRDQLHDQIDELMKTIAAHKGHEQDTAKEWQPIQKELKKLVKKLLKIIFGPGNGHKVDWLCFVVAPGKSSRLAKRQSSPKRRAAKK